MTPDVYEACAANEGVRGVIPTVSFIVPCYKLAHLLPECLTSILEQTFRDFELIVLDDCSPDDTPEVVRRFADRRVRYVRNRENLGHLRNYNAGIELSRGRYVWLISADDRLRRPYVLEQFVALAERHPKVGFVFCPGVGLRGNEETGPLEYSRVGEHDAVLDGRTLLQDRLLAHNCVVAASGMVRRQLYEKLGAFPLDLPYAGDWYLWCLFALHADVGYLAEPMVHYREHDLNMTKALSVDGSRRLRTDDFAVRWRIMNAIAASEHRGPLDRSRELVIGQSAHALVGRGWFPDAGALSPGEFEALVRQHATSPEVAREIRVRSYVLGGDLALQHGDRRRAATLYTLALRSAPPLLEPLSKVLLLRLGAVGDHLRAGMAHLRATARAKWSARRREGEPAEPAVK